MLVNRTRGPVLQPQQQHPKIIDLEFVEMADVVGEDVVPLVPGRSTLAKAPITNISTWMERYSIMATAIATRFPEKAPELFAYQATIIRSERNYEAGIGWPMI